MSTAPHTEHDVARLVHQAYALKGHAVFQQVPTAPVQQGGRLVSRVIDVLAMDVDAWTTAFEIKTRRQDFVSDVRHPEKQAPWVAVADQHYYVTLPDVAAADEVPEHSGLLHVVEVSTASGPGYVLREVKPAPARDGVPKGAPGWLTHRLLQSASNVLGILQGWQSSGDDVVDLSAALEREKFAAAAARLAADRAEERAEAWQMLAAAQGHKVPCASCGAAIVPTRVSAGVPAGWRHAQPHLTTDCPGNTQGVRPREDTP